MFFINISQGTVTSRLRCSGILNDQFIINLLLSVPVSVNIWWSYKAIKVLVAYFWQITRYNVLIQTNLTQVRHTNDQNCYHTMLSCTNDLTLRSGELGGSLLVSDAYWLSEPCGVAAPTSKLLSVSTASNTSFSVSWLVSGKDSRFR